MGFDGRLLLFDKDSPSEEWDECPREPVQQKLPVTSLNLFKPSNRDSRGGSYFLVRGEIL